MQKRTAMVVSILAVLAMLLPAAASAESARAGLLDFVRGGAESITSESIFNTGPLLRETVGDLMVTVTEAAFDKSRLFIVTTIELLPGVKGELVNADEPGMAIPAKPVITSDGSPAYYVDAMVSYQSSSPDACGAKMNEDGSISNLDIIYMVEDGATAKMYCQIRYVKVESGTNPEEGVTENAFLPFTLETPPTLESRVLTAPVTIPEVGVTIEAAHLFRKYGMSYARIYFRYSGLLSQADRSADTVGMRFVDENLQPVYDWLATGQRIAGDRFQTVIPFGDERLPDRMRLQLGSYRSADNSAFQQLASVALSFERGREPAPSGYTYPDNAARDFRNLHFPWQAQRPLWWYVVSDEPLEMLRFPDDPDSRLMSLNPGTLLFVNAVFNDWAMVFIGDYMTYNAPFGYVKLKGIGEACAVSGIPVAVVAESAGSSVKGRYEPDETATVWGTLNAGEKALVIGQEGDWFFVAMQLERGISIVGYVPAASLRLTDEKTKMALDDGNG